MRVLGPVVLGLSLLAEVAALVQAPFDDPSQHKQKELAESSSGSLGGWDLDVGPSVNDTNNLIFDTAFSLLQRWPNTRWRNGHTIIPAFIAPGTILYHGWPNYSIPDGPDWVATDAEHSFMFARESGWMLTLMATRELKLLYFDGASAAKGCYGTMDTQDLLFFGKIVQRERNNSRTLDWDRIQLACEWGKQWGIDGFVRLQMDFEIMLCSFSEGVEIVSMLHMLDRDFWEDSSPPPFPHTSIASSGDFRVFYEIVGAATWHNYNPGETRVKLDYAGMVTFYDTDSFPSLADIRNGIQKDRTKHRVGGVAKDELAEVKKRIEGIISKPERGSGVDWRALMNVIVDRYASRLELLSFILNESTFDDSARLDKAKSQIIVMLTPYFVAGAVPSERQQDNAWAVPIFRSCATAHTARFSMFETLFTTEERVLLGAVRGTAQEICRVLVKMFSKFAISDAQDSESLKEMLGQWRDETTSLMQWLDWSVWVKCRPVCNDDEMCYLSTWPYDGEGPEWWGTEPKPRCVGRIKPYPGFFKFNKTLI